MTTETLSAAPLSISSTADTRKLVDRANPMMQTPKRATETSSVTPARRNGGRWAIQTPITTEPMAGAARSRPRPWGPVRSILAKIGSSAAAPPKSTEKRSSDIAPRTMGCFQRKRRPICRLSPIVISLTSGARVST